MKKYLRYFIIFFLCLTFQILTPKADTLNILFIGNSYTYVNDLPGLFKGLALAGGFNVKTDSYTPGGYSLENHWNDTACTNKIKLAIWNAVVLQEQSQIPAINYLRYNSMYPSARHFDSLIRLGGAHTIFFETWGRKYGGIQCIDTSCSPPFVNYYHMQDSLKSAYTQISNLLFANMAPVGEAWRLAYSLDTNTDLWQSDFSHPSQEGSYLAACVFYVKIFNQSPAGLKFNGGLNDSLALYLQNIAAQSVIGIIRNPGTPYEFSLSQNYPNPFNPVTKITFTLPLMKGAGGMNTKLIIYDILGREVATLVNEQLKPGTYEYSWDGSNFASGIYFYKLQDGDFTETRKMVLMK